MAKSRLIQKIELQMLHQAGGFRGQAIYQCHWNLHQSDQTDPGCHGNENLGILTQNWLERGQYKIELRMLLQTGGFRVQEFADVIKIYIRPTPVAMVQN